MREILFRAKANSEVRDGEWVYGSLLAESQNTFPIIARDYDNDEDWISVIEWDTVDSTTIGQFTGLYDKNGKRIFEGDIVRVKGLESDENWKDYDEIGKVVFVDGAFLIEVPKEYNGIKCYSKIHSYYMTTSDWVTREVVGNRFDNAELLTAERNNNEN